MQGKSIGVNEKVSAHLAVCPVRSLTCIQSGSETETSYTFIICKKRNLSSSPCERIFCWRQYGLADDFRAGAANIALRGKGAERTPRALVVRRTGICLCSCRDGVRDGSGNRAAGADASTPRGFPTGCCEYRLAARWWRCGESNPGPDDH